MTKLSGLPALLVWLGVAVGPPVAVILAWRKLLARHPVLAIGLVLAYVVVVAVVGFVGGVARDLGERWRKRAADSIDLFLVRKVSRFDPKYRKYVRDGLRFIDTKGLATTGQFTPELDKVFVDVTLMPRPPHAVGTGVLTGPPDTGRQALAGFLGQAKPAVLAVLGGPGSGKTTLLQHTARRARLRKQTRRGPRRDLPILLYLRDHVKAITDSPNGSLAAVLRSTLGDLASAEPDGWLERQLADGRCLVLLDGLDEVARKEDRKAVTAWAERQIQQYPDNHFVITSRPQGYLTAPVRGAQSLQVREFTAEQREQFVRNWYLAEERHSTDASDDDIKDRARSAADDLLRRLDQMPALHDLAANPLLLTMIAIVHRYRGALPGSRAKLYAEICEVVLQRRQEAKNLASQLGGASQLGSDKKETVLSGLAYTMMARRVRDLSRDELLKEIRAPLGRMSGEVTAADFLADVSSNGLLIERETELYSFAHQTFQEYLAAAHIKDKNLVAVLAGAVEDPWWRETTLLYAARADADAIVRACLKAGTVPALALAFDCADQGSEIDADLRDRLDKVLADVETETDPERRRLAEGVLLTRHLHDKVRLSGDSRLCVRPVTRDIYRLFRADTGTPPPDAPPPDEPAAGIAVGMRASDATAFVEWANTITGGEPVYRLPSRAELDDPAARRIVAAASPAERVVPWDDSSTPVYRPFPGSALTTELRADITAFIDLDDLDRARARALVLDLALDRVLDSDLDLALDRAFDSDLDLDLALDRVLAYALARARDLAYARDLDVHRSLGRSLAYAVSAASSGKNSQHDVAGKFTNALVAKTGIDTRGVPPVALEALADTLDQATEKLRGVSSQDSGHGIDSLPRELLTGNKLRDYAVPVLERGASSGPRTTARARLAALLLAGEADGLGHRDIGDEFRRVAAGVTWLEMRRGGQIPATEVIMLAVD